jgi:CubicO group peptidase (beta-lactamase class C family)
MLRCAALTSTCGLLNNLAAVEAPDRTERAAIDALGKEFIQQNQIAGLSVSFAHQGIPAYEAAYGYADIYKKESVTSRHLFRIASVSKPITSVAVYTLMEKGKLSLDDQALGPQGVLSQFSLPQDGSQWLREIRVRHLLTHTCGGWQNDYHDPMFSWPALSREELIAKTLDTQKLLYPPGSHYAYSNFGYCLLGRIIEAKSGASYEDYVREHVLRPCGIHNMAIGQKTSNVGMREVQYYGPGDPYSLDPQRMDSHGGWIATPSDLVTFALHVDGFPFPSDILLPTTEKDMVTPTTANPRYAKGWAVNSLGNWWHNGGMPGTASILVRTASGMCWAATANSSTHSDMDELMWKMARCVRQWHA